MTGGLDLCTSIYQWIAQTARQWGWFLLLVIGPEPTWSVPKITDLALTLHRGFISSFVDFVGLTSPRQFQFLQPSGSTGISLLLIRWFLSNVGRDCMRRNQTFEMRVGRKVNRRFDRWQTAVQQSKCISRMQYSSRNRLALPGSHPRLQFHSFSVQAQGNEDPNVKLHQLSRGTADERPICSQLY